MSSRFHIKISRFDIERKSAEDIPQTRLEKLFENDKEYFITGISFDDHMREKHRFPAEEYLEGTVFWIKIPGDGAATQDRYYSLTLTEEASVNDVNRELPKLREWLQKNL